LGEVLIVDIRTVSTLGYQLWSHVTTSSGGYVDIEANSFQMISIPVIHGYWSSITHQHVHDDTTPATIYNYIIEQIEDIYSVSGDTMVEVFNTLIGGQGNYWNFVVGVTNPASPHNFKLAYIDSGTGDVEYTGFFIKSVHPSSFTIQWGDT
jgi:hypothetical protein